MLPTSRKPSLLEAGGSASKLLKNRPLDEALDFLGVSSFYDTVPAARETDLDAVISTLRDSGVLGGAEDATAPLSR